MIDKEKQKLDPKKQWAKFIIVGGLYLLFLLWVQSWLGLVVLPFIFDNYITKKIRWTWWKDSEGPVRMVMSWVDALIFALVAVYFINLFLFQNYVIPSSSLEKSLLTGDYLAVSKVSYGPRIPQTPLTMPLTQNTMPITGTRSYFEWPHWDYRRVKGLGEVQLGAILEQILAPGQYACNVATVPGSTNRVEYAIKMPGQNGTVWLPIDSKFPGDTYAHLQDAQASGNAQAVENARHALELVLRSEAKDIREKYVEPPYTTAFGILFLPFEGLYAEVVNAGLLEVLQRDYQVNVAGPSTMAAILNSLQMSYQTFKLQKRTDDVLRVLSAVKAELPRYQKALRRAQQQIETAGKTVEGIITTRTNVMERKLKDIDALEDAEEADEILGLTSASLLADQKDED